MTIKESYNCPNCGKPGTLMAVQMLFEDAKYDMLKCNECGVEWRSYYKTSDVSTEVTFVPEEVAKANAPQGENAPVEPEVVEGEVLTGEPNPNAGKGDENVG